MCSGWEESIVCVVDRESPLHACLVMNDLHNYK